MNVEDLDAVCDDKCRETRECCILRFTSTTGTEEKYDVCMLKASKSKDTK